MSKVNEILDSIFKINSKLKVVAVTKKKSAAKVLEISKFGLSNFGENYLQEAQEKMSSLSENNFTWHFIGNIQSKKLNQIVGNFSLIHSVDRIKLIKKIDILSMEKQMVQEILLQINTSGELSKGGFEKSELDEALKIINECKNINVRGLMCMPELTNDLGKIKNEFKNLKEIFESLRKKIAPQHNFTELSMGTSGDYMLAIEQGATIIRLGRVLLGERS